MTANKLSQGMLFLANFVKSMESRTARSIRFAGWVLMLSGIALVFFPQEVMLFFWKDYTASYWLRSLGYFIFIEGLLSYKISFYDLMPVYRWIINYRLFQIVFFAALLIVDFANPGLMLYATLNFLLGLRSFGLYKRENN